MLCYLNVPPNLKFLEHSVGVNIAGTVDSISPNLRLLSSFSQTHTHTHTHTHTLTHTHTHTHTHIDIDIDMTVADRSSGESGEEESKNKVTFSYKSERISDREGLQDMGATLTLETESTVIIDEKRIRMGRGS